MFVYVLESIQYISYEVHFAKTVSYETWLHRNLVAEATVTFATPLNPGWPVVRARSRSGVCAGRGWPVSAWRRAGLWWPSRCPHTWGTSRSSRTATRTAAGRRIIVYSAQTLDMIPNQLRCVVSRWGGGGGGETPVREVETLPPCDISKVMWWPLSQEPPRWGQNSKPQRARVRRMAIDLWKLGDVRKICFW